MKKVLVVGANSYIGKKFKEYVELSNTDEIVVDMVSASNGSWEKADFSKYDVVVHLAAIVHRKEKKKMKPLYYRVNHQLVVDVAIKAKNSKVGHFIFMSTAAIYGSKLKYITKDTKPKPDTYYGKSKLEAENDISNLSSEDFAVSIIRPPMVYGEDSPGNYRKLVKLSKFLFIIPDFHNKRSIINIDMLNELLDEIITYRKEGIFHPQDKEYLDTCSFVANTRNVNGKKTILISHFNIIIRFFLKYSEKLNKIFGDFQYIDLDDK